MVYVRRYFMEITTLDEFTDEELLIKLDAILPRTNIKLHRSSIIEVRHKT